MTFFHKFKVLSVLKVANIHKNAKKIFEKILAIHLNLAICDWKSESPMYKEFFKVVQTYSSYPLKWPSRRDKKNWIRKQASKINHLAEKCEKPRKNVSVGDNGSFFQFFAFFSQTVDFRGLFPNPVFLISSRRSF